MRDRRVPNRTTLLLAADLARVPGHDVDAAHATSLATAQATVAPPLPAALLGPHATAHHPRHRCHPRVLLRVLLRPPRPLPPERRNPGKPFGFSGSSGVRGGGLEIAGACSERVRSEGSGRNDGVEGGRDAAGRDGRSGVPDDSQTNPRTVLVRALSEAVRDAAAVGDVATARVAVEALGRLLGEAGVAGAEAEVVDLAARRHEGR